MGSILYWSTTLGHGAWTVIDIPSDTSLEKAGFPTPQQVSITNSFLVMVGLYFNPPFSVLGFLSALNHCRSCKNY